MTLAIVPTIVLVVGLILFFISSNPKVSRVGEIMLFCALLVVLFGIGAHGVEALGIGR